MAANLTAGEGDEEPEKAKRRRFRASRKVVVGAAAGVLLLGVSAATAYVMGGADLLRGDGSRVYGLDCTLVDSVSFRQGGERWVRQYISVDHSDGPSRMRTAVRVARHSAGADRADLVLVVVLDRNGPHERSMMRDHAIGAQLVYAPHPARVASLQQQFTARYTEAEATDAGYFFGKTEHPTSAELIAMAAVMKKPYGCATPEATPAPGAAKEKAHGDAVKKTHH